MTLVVVQVQKRCTYMEKGNFSKHRNFSKTDFIEFINFIYFVN